MKTIIISLFVIFGITTLCLCDCSDPIVGSVNKTINVEPGHTVALVSLFPGVISITSNVKVELRCDPLPCVSDEPGLVLASGKAFECKIDKGGTHWISNIGDKTAKITIKHIPRKEN